MALPIVNSSRYSTIIPSTQQKIDFRPYLVKEEKILMIAIESKDRPTMIRALKDVIKACVFDEIDIRKLTMFDIEFLFLQLRSKSTGEVSQLHLKCSNTECGETNKVSVDLTSIKAPEIDEESKTIKLNNDIGVVVRYPSITDMEKYKEEELETTQGIMNLIIDCIDTIFDSENMYDAKNETRNALIDFIDNLNSAQFAKITNFFSTMPTISHMIEYKCTKCGNENKVKVEGLESFFT